jgi:hypothetical protein
MLEIKDGKIKIWYRFKSELVDEELCRYDDDEFCYNIDKEDAKDVIAYSYLKCTDNNDVCSSRVIREVLDFAAACEEFDWDETILKNEDILKEEYEMDAMIDFAERHI